MAESGNPRGGELNAAVTSSTRITWAPMTDLHVIADGHTMTWRVYDDADASAPLSEHTSTTDAELAAHALSRRRGGAPVIVHDCYHRTHQSTPSLPAGPTAAQAAPARRPELVRERTYRRLGG